MKLLALAGACVSLAFAACGGSGSDQATKPGQTTEPLAKAQHRRPRAPTILMSKAEIAKLPPLPMVRPSGPPPRHLRIIDLRKGSGPGVPEHDWVTNREEVFIRYVEGSYPEARAGRLNGPYGPMRVLPEYTIRGLAVGLTGMKVGGRRELIIPPKLVFPDWKPSWGYAPYVNVYVIDLVGMEPPRDRLVEYRNRPFGGQD
jgi:peptidylprolyl isomerase